MDLFRAIRLPSDAFSAAVQAGGSARFTLLLALLLLIPPLLIGCQFETKLDTKIDRVERRVKLDPLGRSHLPKAPHVREIHARPTDAMIALNQGMTMEFRVLDKRTLDVTGFKSQVGQTHNATGLGTLQLMAYVQDLMIRDNRAVRSDGHVNPAVWVELRDDHGRLMHEGWLFSRDATQTAWDHPRYDLTFLGPVLKERSKKRRRSG